MKRANETQIILLKENASKTQKSYQRFLRENLDAVALSGVTV